MYCLQGHVRKIKYSMEDKVKVLDHEPIENCHGWGEKKPCECYVTNSIMHDFWIKKEYKFCPDCGRSLGNPNNAV